MYIYIDFEKMVCRCGKTQKPFKPKGFGVLLLWQKVCKWCEIDFPVSKTRGVLWKNQ